MTAKQITTPSFLGARSRPEIVGLCVLAASLAILTLWYWLVASRSIGLTGDEPHYIMITHSLASDGDLDLRNNYSEMQGDAWYPGLGPYLHAHDYMGDGRLFSQHTPGLPLLLLPAHWLLDHHPTRAARITMLAISALILHQFYLLCVEITKEYRFSLIAWLVLAMSVPMLYMSSQVYADVPAALLVLVSARAIRRMPSLGAVVLLSLCVSFLPFVHVRSIPLCVILVLAAYVRLRWPVQYSMRYLLLALCCAGATFFTWFYVANFGNPLANAQYAHLATGRGDLSAIPRMVIDLIFDREIGVVPVAPILLLAVTGTVAGLIVRDRFAILLATLAGAYWLAVAGGIATGAGNWGWAMPWRMIFPVYPLMVLLAAWAVFNLRACRVIAVPLVAAGLLVCAGSVAWPGGFYARSAGVMDMPILDRLQGYLPSTVFATERKVPASRGVSFTGEPANEEVSGSVCATAGRDEPGYLNWGIRKGMLPGTMDVSIFLRGEGAPEGHDLGFVQLVRERVNQTMASRQVTSAAFQQDGVARMTFSIASATAMIAEAQVIYEGTGTLCLDRVEFQQTTTTQHEYGYTIVHIVSGVMLLLGLVPAFQTRRKDDTELAQ